jgi:predicted Zn-dependent protease
VIRPPKLILVVSLFSVAGATAWIGWTRFHDARQWARSRPALPDPAGDAAPGLDARLVACATRFAAWPPDPAALAEFAQLCQVNGHPAEAMAAYQVLVSIDRADPRWPHRLAQLLTGYGRIAEALPLLENATALAPREPVVWQRLGEVRLKNNQPTEAGVAFAEVLKLRPADAHALFGLARCDLQAGRFTAARARLQEAVAAHPDFPGAQSLLASVWERLGNPAAAQAARLRVRGDGRYTDAPDPWAVDLAAYGHDAYTLLVAASAQVSDGRPRLALPLLERALVLDPRDARIHRQLGNTYARLGDLPAARAPLERAVALAPGDEKMRTDLINLLKGMKDDDAVEQTVLAALAANPGSTAFRFEAGLIASRQGRTVEAIGHFSAVWADAPAQTAAPCELAAVYFAAGRAAEGEAVLERLAMDHPSDPAVLTLLVRRGIETRDPRTGDWLRRAQDTGKALSTLAELRQAYFARFGVMP